MSNLISPFVDNSQSKSNNSNATKTLSSSNLDSYAESLFGKNYLADTSSSIISNIDDKPKRGRPKKESGQTIRISGADMTYDPNVNPDGSVNYHAPYNETDMILKTAIMQTDSVINDISNDIAKIREAKAMTSKYKYITDLSSAMGTLLSTKISAARELNNSINHAQDMQYKMQKELKAMEVSKDDNKSIMDMYNAFMSIPTNTMQTNPLGPSIQSMTLPKDTGLSAIDLVTGNMNTTGISSEEIGYQSYLANMTPEQNRMRHENDPNIQTIVVFDQSNGHKWFDVIDVRTGMSVPNMAKPDDFLLDDTRPDIVNGVARNSNINVTYPLKVVGARSSIQDY